MDKAALHASTSWVFDLDNTLYPPSARLFDQIEARMTAYVMYALGIDEARADALRAEYWRSHGTTLAGLMAEHDLDPDPFLRDVHDISLAPLNRDPALREAIARLPGRKIIYTNGTAPYARRVCHALGLAELFDAVYGIEDAGYLPKPRAEAFDAVFARDGLEVRGAVIFEDDARNLEVPSQLGMRTVHVSPHPVDAAHIQYRTAHLADFLQDLHP